MLSDDQVALLKDTDLLALVLKLSREVPGVEEAVVKELNSNRNAHHTCELDGDPDLQFFNNLLLGSTDRDGCEVEQTSSPEIADSTSPACVTDDSSSHYQAEKAKDTTQARLSCEAAAFTPGSADGEWEVVTSKPKLSPSVDPLQTHSFVNGVIFKATTKTRVECLQRGLFGLPHNQWSRVKYNCIPFDTAVFLYNTSTYEMEGVFVATEPPALDIEPSAWKHAVPSGRTIPVRDQGSPFPAQVRVRQLAPWPPAAVERFEHLLAWHPNGSSFDLILDCETTKALIASIRPK